MRKSIKIVLVVVFGFIGVLFVGAWLSSPYVNQDVEGGLNQTNDTAGNQTVLPINSINTTSANGSIRQY